MSEPQGSFDEQLESRLDRGLRAALSRDDVLLSRERPDRPGPMSVLGALGVRGVKVPHVLLRAESGGEVRPVGAPPAGGEHAVAGDSGASRSGTSFELRDEIGRGGMGLILRGRDHDLGRDVALKVLRSELVDDASAVRRFVEEAQIGGQLQHPGIVPVYEFGLMGDRRPYFAMKLVKGRTLAALLSERPKDAGTGRFLAIFEAICQTMAYAHSRGVVHRDLKPANVMVGAFGEVQVMDWGLARVLPSRQGEPRVAGASEPEPTVIATRRRDAHDGSVGAVPERPSEAGSVMGTPSYMAPEQARGEIDRVDERVDVFALGAMLCEILTGRPPYDGETAAVLKRARDADLGDASRRLESCGADRELVVIARDCLSAERDSRPRSARELASRIHSFLIGVEERARAAQIEAAAAVAKAGEERRARRLAIALLGSLALLVVIGAGGFWWLDRGRRDRIARTRAAVAPEIEQSGVLLGRAQAAPNPDPTEFDAARAAAERARSLLVAGEAESFMHSEVDALVARIESARASAATAFAVRRRERDMVARLESIRMPADEALGIVDAHLEHAKLRDSGYARAFRDFGFDLHGDDEAALGRRLGAEAIALELAAALDDWAEARRTTRPPIEGAERLIRIAAIADPDPLRERLRRLLEAPGPDREEWGALRHDPQIHSAPAETSRLLARGLLRAGLRREAILVLEEALVRSPDDAVLHVELGLLEDRSAPAEHFSAMRHFTAAAVLKPASAGLWYRIGLIQTWSGEHEKAMLSFAKAEELDPGAAWPSERYAAAMQSLGRDAEAIEKYRQVLARHPERGLANNGLAWLLATSADPRLRDAEAAVRAARAAVAAEPGSDSVINTLGTALWVAGHADEAVTVLLRTPETRGGMNAWDWVILSLALERIGRHEEAREYYRRTVDAMAIDKTSPPTLRRFRAEADAVFAPK